MTEPISCAACAGQNVYVVEQWPTGKWARAMACRNCGLLFVHPQPSREAPHAHNTPEVPLQASPAPHITPAPARHKGAAGALMAVLDRHFPARRPAPGARVLDYGCGNGAWLNAFQYCGWETFGIESSTDAAFASHTRLTAVPSDPQFDLVIVYQVLQRLSQPLDTLRQLSGALRPGGYCLVSVPRLDALAVHRDVSYCLHPRKNIVAFTEACLRGLLARAGLEVVAALHELDKAFTHGEPLRLRLLARKVDSPALVSDAASALQPVLQALSALEAPAAGPAAAPRPTAPTDCPGCSGHDVQMLEMWRLSVKGTFAAACIQCGLLFAHPQPSRKDLDALYTTDVYREWKESRLTDNAWKKQEARPQSSGERPRTPAIFTALDGFFPATRPAAGARVFDFGCGPGTWLDSFQDHGWETYGLETCTDAAFVRHKRLLAVPAEPQFDLVFVYHVLEHLPRPLATLCEVGQALLPGGYCFVSVPRLDTLAVHLQPKYCLCPPHHIVAFTEACLRGFLARAGLEFVASFHDSKSAFKRGLPTKLQLLARKTATPPLIEPDPASALKPVIEAFIALRKSATQTRSYGVEYTTP